MCSALRVLSVTLSSFECYTIEAVEDSNTRLLVEHLQKHLAGEILTGREALEAFSRDGSLCQKTPRAVILARNEQDVRKTLLFLSQAAAKGKIYKLTIRGGGSDLSGAAVTDGLLMVLPTYLNKIISFDARRRLYKAQAGITLEALNMFLQAHDQCVPVLKNLPPQSTLGGAVSNNSYSRYSLKYGLMVNSIVGLKVVLSNGDVISVRPLSLSQLKKKIALGNLEGEIYKTFYDLFYLQDSPHYYKTSPLFRRKDNLPDLGSGYDLSRLCHPDGSFDLRPLFCGAQGNLGVITEVTVQAQVDRPLPQAALLRCPDLNSGLQLVQDIKSEQPAAATLMNGNIFSKIKEISPTLLADFEHLSRTEAVLILEFDTSNRGRGHRQIRRVLKRAVALGIDGEMIHPPELYGNLNRLRSALMVLATRADRGRYLFSGFLGAYVPPENMSAFYTEACALLASFKLDCLFFGEIGLGNANLIPHFDLKTTLQKRRFYQLQKAYFDLVVGHGGRLSLSNQEGRLPGHLLSTTLDQSQRDVLRSIKDAFDPYKLLSPDIKLTATGAEMMQSLGSAQDWQRFCSGGISFG